MTGNKAPADLPPGIALAWGFSPAERRRGPKPAFNVKQIVDIAIEVADSEGFAGLSMPKIASRLGVTANALYRYVRSKEELLVLLAEAAWGPPPSDVPRAKTWRDAASAWTHAMIVRCQVHPWLLDLPVRTAPLTPHQVAWLEVFLEAMADSGLNRRDTLGCALLLDGYARSTARLSRTMAEAEGVTTASVADFLQPLLEERGFPRMAALMNGSYVEDKLPRDDIEFGLNRVLDGIAALISARRAEAPHHRANGA